MLSENCETKYKRQYSSFPVSKYQVVHKKYGHNTDYNTINSVQLYPTTCGVAGARGCVIPDALVKLSLDFIFISRRENPSY